MFSNIQIDCLVPCGVRQRESLSPGIWMQTINIPASSFPSRTPFPLGVSIVLNISVSFLRGGLSQVFNKARPAHGGSDNVFDEGVLAGLGFHVKINIRGQCEIYSQFFSIR